MITLDKRSKKKSKDAQAERILQSLSQKTRSCLQPLSKKIKKRKKSILEESIRLTYKDSNTKKFLHWLMPKSRHKNKEKMISISENQPSNYLLSECSNPNEEVNYAAIFELAYEDLKSESSHNKNTKPINKKGDEQCIRAHDDFSGIEYNPIDNFFYLVRDVDSLKRPLFKNKAISSFEQNSCVMLNVRVIDSLKKSFELDSFLC